jgi:arabinose-5-phosphate isomerase
MKVRDVMAAGDANPVVGRKACFRDVLETMNAKGMGAVCVVEMDGTLAGVITDGDVRRLLLTTQMPLPSLFLVDAEQVMTTSPKRISADASLEDALDELERYQFWVLPAVESDDKLAGLVHMHRLLKAMLEEGR